MINGYRLAYSQHGDRSRPAVAIVTGGSQGVGVGFDGLPGGKHLERRVPGGDGADLVVT